MPIKRVTLASCAASAVIAIALPIGNMASAADPTKQSISPQKVSKTPAARCPPPSQLPVLVQEMHEAIAAAAASGDPKNLLDPIQWNELKPDFFGKGPSADPVAEIKGHSADGSGLDVLAAISEILALPCVILPLGADIENNRIYVFPYLAESDLSNLSAEQKVDLYRLYPEKLAAPMIKSGTYRGWSISIGADGTWHQLAKAP